MRDECQECGTWMLNPEKHRQWHKKLTAVIQSTGDVIKLIFVGIQQGFITPTNIVINEKELAELKRRFDETTQ